MVERTLRTGVERGTGRMLRGRAHAEQSVRIIFSTFLGTELMRLDFGSDLRALRGENLTAVNVLRAYAALVHAVHTQEPNIRFTKIQPSLANGRDGAIAFVLSYLHFPYGHLGDYSVSEAADMRVPVTALARGTGAVS
ncbi:hypothetical protein CCR97_23380 [Rhodoplanes elegans]|uniref:IraD/Gp25-like domain-containing protein n=1 Tax=Rhodoplanes elegans TaxID=29408 RepID=A0A327KHI9_9BRAD|nr:GPW/gp25 family protein [Rhodoplanes elegans]MBK5961124.1 hypothetical protein [Rhodoplanes elegans]RAI38160.1 hypothetical protein CH338_13660 [Rhodoplanes elegans]